MPPWLNLEVAARLDDVARIDTLEDLEAAAHDGRLEKTELIGDERLQGIRESLAGRLGRVREKFPSRLRLPSPHAHHIADGSKNVAIVVQGHE